MDDAAKSALLEYLNPYGTSSNARVEAVTCLIAFDFEAFETIRTASNDLDPEVAFFVEAQKAVAKAGPAIAKALTDAGLGGRQVELFLFPLPSTAIFRTLFQNRIGWTEA